MERLHSGRWQIAVITMILAVAASVSAETISKISIEADSSVNTADLVTVALTAFEPTLAWTGTGYGAYSANGEKRQFPLGSIVTETEFSSSALDDLLRQVNIFLDNYSSRTDRGKLIASAGREGSVLNLTVSKAKRSWLSSLFGAKRPAEPTHEVAAAVEAAEVVSAVEVEATRPIVRTPAPVAGNAALPEPPPVSTPSAPESAQEPAASVPAAEAIPPQAVAGAISATTVEAVDTDGDRYAVSSFKLEYENSGEDYVPPVDDLLAGAQVSLLATSDGFVAPRKGQPGVAHALADLSGSFHGSAIRAVNAAIVRQLGAQGYVGVYAVPHQDDISEDGSDAREGRSDLRVVVWLSRVGQIRTVGAGERMKEGERVDRKQHGRIAANSPVKAGELLMRKDVEDYAELLSRHPGRQVDLSLGSGEEMGEVVLDYIVTENKPWLGYINITNTGTPTTDRLRQRVGFVLNQVTNRDDTMGIEYSTANFKSSHAGNIYYETPLITDKLRLRFEGGGGEFTASEVGLRNVDYEGESWTAGASAKLNVLQHKGWFADVSTGFRFQGVKVTQDLAGLETIGDETLFLPNVGLSLERKRPINSVRANAKLEWNVPGTHDNTEVGLQRLGRPNPSKGWSVLHYAIENRTALDSLWLQILGRYDSGKVSRFELQTRIHGQYTENNRLIPQAQRTVGGMNSVRGYTESIAAGDSAAIFNMDFKLHLTRFLGVREGGTVTLPGNLPFKWAPAYDYDRPDWDLILRAFFDYAKIKNEDAFANNEIDHELMSVGVGLDLGIKKHFTLSLDWGHALKEVIERGQTLVEDGDDRLHVSGTVLF